MKFLFINDNGDWLRSLGRIFSGRDNVVFAECHSIDEALVAISEHNPDVIFLDHSLTEGGIEGLDVARQLEDSGIKIYSTSANSGVRDQYAKLGISHIRPNDLAWFRKIIEQK